MNFKKIPTKHILKGTRYRQDLGDLTSLKESIKQKGLIQPITVTPNNGGAYTLIAGGRRLASCVQLGLKEIPCMVREDVSDLDLREMELIENTHRQDMTWQEKFPLIKKIHELQLEKHGTSWQQKQTAELLGFDQSYMTHIFKTLKMVEDLPQLIKCTDFQDVRREYKKLIEQAKTKIAIKKSRESLLETKGTKINSLSKAQVKELQVNKLLVKADNSFNVGDALYLLTQNKSEIACFAEVDPPYAVDLIQLRENKGAATENLEEYNEVEEKDYPDFLLKAATETFRILKPNTFCIWWFGSRHYDMVRTTLENVGFNVDMIPAIWYKEGAPGNIMNPDIMLARQYEPFFVCRKGQPRLNIKPHGNVFCYNNIAPQKRIHPTERPLPLIRDIISTFAQLEGKNPHVLVPFLGSGATLRACYAEGVSGWGYDLSDNLKTDFLTKLKQELEDGSIGYC